MDDEQLAARVRELHAEGMSTNQIARQLEVPRGRVAPLVRALVRSAKATTAEPAVAGCWVSAGWSVGLSVPEGHDWPDRRSRGPEPSGLVGVLVARETRRGGDEVSVAGYLVDTYCLGVKDALPPRRMSGRRLHRRVEDFFDGFEGPPVEVPIELARHLVWGAVDYARGLGFEPHPDLRLASGHLGPLDGPCAIGFGHEGKPYYIQGPYDDAGRILRTLERTVGRDNFHFLVGADAFELA